MLIDDPPMQLGFVKALASADTAATVFAIVRNKTTSGQLLELVKDNDFKNVHVLEADVTDNKAIQVHLGFDLWTLAC